MTAAAQPEHVRVVLVDDTADLRELLRFALEQHEFRVVGEAADGRSGVERVAAAQPDLVLLDLAMPVMDGFEALPLVRRACPTATVLVLSGFDAATTGSRAVELGAHGYLEKGSPLRATIAQVREALAERDPRAVAGPVARPATPAPTLTVLDGEAEDTSRTTSGADLSVVPTARGGASPTAPAP